MASDWSCKLSMAWIRPPVPVLTGDAPSYIYCQQCKLIGTPNKPYLEVMEILYPPDSEPGRKQQVQTHLFCTACGCTYYPVSKYMPFLLD